jgi:hypothetical protein
MAGKLTVVISQAQGKHPLKRQLEEQLAADMIMDSQINVSLVPHLYDMSADHTGLLFMRAIQGDIVILSWLYPRACRWILDRQGIRGQEGTTLLVGDDEEDEAEVEAQREASHAQLTRESGGQPLPKRKIYVIDLRVTNNVKEYITEIKRIAAEKSVQTFDLMEAFSTSPKKEKLQSYIVTPEKLALNGNGNGHAHANGNGSNAGVAANGLTPVMEENVPRRWYPVIDYARCTNCMECIDFCLFGVYGVDHHGLILVESQDSCKKGCPACSRVCPENAIMFPLHKTPAIAGADGEVAGLKIDLSKLFGGGGLSALEEAVSERDAELVKDGREAVGAAVGMPKRQPSKQTGPKDDLDDLLDSIDAMGV